jgi:TraX protein
MSRRHQTPSTANPSAPSGIGWISNGSLEALKWVGLLLMSGDHVNKYLLDEGSPALYALGRMVMPLFGFVLMANLVRPGALQTGVHRRVMKRLAIFGLLATPAFVHLIGWWPLNILGTLLLATLIAWLLERGSKASRFAAGAAFLIGGAMVEFWWPALLCCLGAWAFLRRPDRIRLIFWIMGTASLVAINGSFAAVAALLLIWGVRKIEIPLPRNRWLFYAFYPAHLTLIASFV